MTRDEIELAFVRTFQCGGVMLYGVSLAERQERVRIAIHKTGMADELLHVEPPLTYSEAFRIWSGRNLEMRKKYRPRSEPSASGT